MELREKLAELSHSQWSGWMKYMFHHCLIMDGNTVIEKESVERWIRQMKTPYSELPEKEKESDRVEADKILVAIKEYDQN